ncbi:amidase [Pseudonocardia lacus]|uniref:amidase n=1 Tax=Pseudonocardia lacus TaxID=2835865 RepID=UPI001BDCED12|nr:amidase [Pseudonocardia lacus]
MSLTEYASHDGVGLARLVAEGEVHPIELVEAAIDRIERRDPVLNAVVHRAFDEARAAAAGELPDGPFRGVPFLVKDLGRPVRGWPSSEGSRFAGTGPATADCVIVERYRAAGLVLLGTTTTPEFGIPGVTTSARLGVTRNPWDPDRIPGGSSGGAAAAVASGMVPMAHGTDGLGSIRIPAACCGLVGLKPTRYRNPADPGAHWQVRGQVADHVLCRTVRDCAAMLDATGHPQPGSPFPAPPKQRPYLHELGRPPGRLRIAWSDATPSGRPVDDEVAAAVRATADALAGLGHDVHQEDLAIDQRAFYRALRTVNAAGFAAEMSLVVERVGREPGDDEIEQLARRAYEAGRALPADAAFRAFGQLQELSWRIGEQLAAVDVFLTPVMGTPAPRVDDLDPLGDLRAFDRASAAAFPFTPPFNVTGQPSMSLPLHRSADGLPIGMMVTARHGDEATLFRLAAQLERELPWSGLHPPIWN